MDDILNQTTEDVFTDGVGTISPELGDLIHLARSESDTRLKAHELKPSAVSQ